MPEKTIIRFGLTYFFLKRLIPDTWYVMSAQNISSYYNYCLFTKYEFTFWILGVGRVYTIESEV